MTCWVGLFRSKNGFNARWLLRCLVIDRLTALSVNVGFALTDADVRVIFMGAVNRVSATFPALSGIAYFLRMLCSARSTCAGT